MKKKDRFIDNGKTVTDTHTGLMWVADGNSSECNNGNTLTWRRALRFCKNLKYAGYSDWRLPTLTELKTLTDESYFPTINPIFSNTEKANYWSETTIFYDTSIAWCVDFYFRGVVSNSKYSRCYVRPVRGGKEGK